MTRVSLTVCELSAAFGGAGTLWKMGRQRGSELNGSTHSVYQSVYSYKHLYTSIITMFILLNMAILAVLIGKIIFSVAKRRLV